MPATTVEKSRQTKPTNKREKKRVFFPAWSGRALVWALLIFSLINFTLWRQTSNDKPSSDLWSGTGSIDLALKDFQNINQAPEVVLLGSSLMMFPFWSMDCELDRGIGDIFHHHGSNALETELKKNGFNQTKVFSFAIFGQMISDAYIYVDEYLKGTKTPQFLVYGVAPRDFSDYDLPSPMATNSFKRLVNLSNFSRYADLYLPGFQDRIDFVCDHVCYFYNKRWRLQQELNKAMEKAYLFFGFSAQNKPKNKDANKAGFMLCGSTEERWQGSQQEYRRRYRNIGERDLSVQMGFLQKLLDTCRERGIKVVLINMPLSDVNRQLMPPGFYAQFRAKIAKISARPDVRLLDIGDSPEFTHLNFWDTAHLDQTGGRKILSKIVPIIKEMKKG